MAEDNEQNNQEDDQEFDDDSENTEAEYGDDLKSAKNQAKNQREKNGAKPGVTGLPMEKKRTVGIVGKIIFVLLLAFAAFLDILSIITADLSSTISWIFDIGFGFGVFVFIAMATGNLLESLYGRRNAINAVQTIVEIIPIINLLPIHIVALIIIYLDIEYDILGKVTKGKISPKKT